MKNKVDANELLKKSYYILALLLLLLFADQLAVLMDYYVLQDDSQYYEFYLVEGNYGMPELIFFGKVVLMLTMVFLWSITNNLVITTVSAGTLGFVLMVASQVKSQYRKELVKYTDMFLQGVAKMSLQYIHIEWGKALVWFLVVLLLVVFVAWYIEKECRDWKRSIPKKIRLIVRYIAAILSLIIMLIYVPWFMGKQNGLDSVGVNEVEYSCHYTVYRFLEKDGISFGEEGVKDSLEKLKEMVALEEPEPCAEDERPNVIVIMSEGWWNTDNIADGKINFSVDPMKAYHELEDECVSGNVSVNIFGGGTYISEMEFLTGTNSATCEATFEEIINNEKNVSMVSYFNNLGYETVGMHPFHDTYYDRKACYNALGFDRTIFEEDMKYTEKYDRFISDNAMVDQIIEEYENRESDAPLFMWNVSIANHGFMLEYENDINYDYNYPVDSSYTDGNEPVEFELQHYINGEYLAGEAYKKLVDYFRKVDEPTVILMYGDHCPGIERYFDKLGIDNSSEEIEELMKQYTTPFLMWKNYSGGNTVEDMQGVNVNVLTAKLIRYAGLPQCNMSRILDLENELVKAYTRYYVVGVDGNRISNFTKQQEEIIKKLRVFQYGIRNGMNAAMTAWESE